MKGLVKKMNRMMFDLASGPIFLMVIGVPIIIIVAVIALIFTSVILIKKARKKNIEAKGKLDRSDSSDHVE